MKKYIDSTQLLVEKLSLLKKRCKCGHTQVVPYSTKREYVLCSWCGSRLYRDDSKQLVYDNKVKKDEFMMKLRTCLNYSKNNQECIKYE